MKPNAQFSSIVVLPISLKFKLFQSFPENRKHIPKTKPIFSNSRETENNRIHYRKGKKDLLVN